MESLTHRTPLSFPPVEAAQACPADSEQWAVFSVADFARRVPLVVVNLDCSSPGIAVTRFFALPQLLKLLFQFSILALQPFDFPFLQGLDDLTLLLDHFGLLADCAKCRFVAKRIELTAHDC